MSSQLAIFEMERWDEVVTNSEKSFQKSSILKTTMYLNPLFNNTDSLQNRARQVFTNWPLYNTGQLTTHCIFTLYLVQHINAQHISSCFCFFYIMRRIFIYGFCYQLSKMTTNIFLKNNHDKQLLWLLRTKKICKKYQMEILCFYMLFTDD